MALSVLPSAWKVLFKQSLIWKRNNPFILTDAGSQCHLKHYFTSNYKKQPVGSISHFSNSFLFFSLKPAWSNEVKRVIYCLCYFFFFFLCPFLAKVKHLGQTVMQFHSIISRSEYFEAFYFCAELKLRRDQSVTSSDIVRNPNTLAQTMSETCFPDRRS